MASSKDVWDEAYNRAKKHFKLGLVQAGMNPTMAAKVNVDAKVMEILSEDNCAYLIAAMNRLKVEEM